MSDIRFACPECDGHIRADESNLGVTVQCPHCSNHIQMVPLPPADPPPSVAAVPPRSETSTAHGIAPSAAKAPFAKPSRPGIPQPFVTRPTGVAIVSWVVFVVGLAGLLMTIWALLTEPTGTTDATLRGIAKSEDTLALQKAFMWGGNIVALVCGVLMLNGVNFGRWLYVIANLVGMIGSFALLHRQALLLQIPAVIVFAVFVTVLFNKNSRRYFHARPFERQNRPPAAGALWWKLAGYVAVLQIAGAVVFLTSNVPADLVAFKSDLMVRAGISRLSVAGYFIRPSGDGQNVLIVVLNIPSRRWIPTEKQYEELASVGNVAGPRTSMQMLRPQRFSLIRSDGQKSEATAFFTMSHDGSESGYITPASSFSLVPLVDRVETVMPSWIVKWAEIPKPFYIQFDAEKRIEVPDKVVAPAIGELAKWKYHKEYQVPRINMPPIYRP